MLKEVCQNTLPFHSHRKITTRFDGGSLTSNAGWLLFGSLDRQHRLCEGFSSCIAESRDRRYVRHDLLRFDQRQMEFPRIDSSKIELMSDRCLIKNRTENLMRRRRIEEEVEFGVAPRVVDTHRRGLRIGPQRNQKPDRGSVGCGNRLRSQTCHYPVEPSAGER